MISPARLAAYRVLRAVNGGADDLPAALAATRSSVPDERDRALAAEIAAGSLRWQGEIDYLITHYARRPVSGLDPEVLDVLRLSGYQLLHLDRVPVSAAVSDAVELTRKAAKTSAAGFVNGVLRAISRNRRSLPLPPRPPREPGASQEWFRLAALEYLSVTLSHPRWLVSRWLSRDGFEDAEARARFNNTPARLTLRANTLKIGRDELTQVLGRHGVQVEATRFAPAGLTVTGGNPLTTPLAGTGLFFVQDEASQLIAALAHAQPGERIFDACASPGGKAVAMAGDMSDRGLLVAADVRAKRLALLSRTVAASGATAIRVAGADLTRGLPFGAIFDCVLVDAPCSGLGTIRRDPEIRWRRSEHDLPAMALAEAGMLERASTVVRPGGRLVYATCSSEPEENDGVIDAFLTRHPDFEPVDPRMRVSRPHPGLDAVLDARGRLRTSPAAHRLESFFAAVLRRTLA